jgi:hypothetical protein
MAGKLHKLSARTVAALTRPGRHSDGGGLYLFVSRDAAALRRRWVFRFTQDRKTAKWGSGRQMACPSPRLASLPPLPAMR